MKRQIIIIASVILSTVMHMRADIRLWDISSENVSQSDVILSKVCELDFEIQESFFGTFTMLDQLLDKVCTIDSKVDVIEIDLDIINTNLITIISKVDIIDQEITIVSSQIDIIRVNDFGGTWTALEELQSTLCDKFDIVFSGVDEIDSKLDQLSAQQESHFVDTFTALQEVSEDVLEILVELNSLSEQLITGISEVDICIMTAKDIMTTVDSKLDSLDIDVEIGFDGTFTAIDALQNKVCTIESKVELIEIILEDDQSATFTALKQVEEKLCTVESKVEVVEVDVSVVDSFADEILINMQDGHSKLCVIDSKIDVIDTLSEATENIIDIIEIKATTIQNSLFDVNDILTKTCTIESKVDVVNLVANTIESSIDILNSDLITIESKLDIVVVDEVNAKECTIESRVDALDLVIQTIKSKVEVIDDGRISIESKLDVIIPDLNSTESKLCIIESTVEVVDENIGTVNSQLVTIDSKVDIIDSEVDIVELVVQTITSTVETIESKVDIISINTNTLLSKVCTIETSIETAESKLEQLSIEVDIVEIISMELNQDMNETWTILAAIEDKVCMIEQQEQAVLSNLDSTVQVDFNGVFTVLDTISEKACSILDRVEVIESEVDIFNNIDCSVDLGGSFTAISSTALKICALESSVDVLVSNIKSIITSQGVEVGTPLTQADFSDTFSITEPGRYFLKEDISFNPGGNSAIYIASDDVHIDLCDRTIKHISSNNNIAGIVIAEESCNISIANGSILMFTAQGIEIGGNSNFIRMSNLTIGGSNADHIRANRGCENIIIKHVSSFNSTAAESDAMDFNDSAGIFVVSCNGVNLFARGINLNASRYAVIRECIQRDVGSGLENQGAFSVINNIGVIQEIPNKDFVIESCKGLGSTSGLVIRESVKNGVIRDCIFNDNTYGLRISMSDTLDSTQRVCVVNNVLSGNSLNGIYIDSDAFNNYFAFNKMWENGDTSVLEDNNEGPNSFLGNSAFRSSGGNYNGGNTVISRAIINETGTFPATEPTYWNNTDIRP